MRQLASMVGISNPYLSQIENGLRAPSEHVLDNIAASLGLDPEALRPEADESPDVLAAIKVDADLSPRQRRALAEVYDSMVAATRAERDRPGRGDGADSGTRRGGSDPSTPREK